MSQHARNNPDHQPSYLQDKSYREPAESVWTGEADDDYIAREEGEIDARQRRRASQYFHPTDPACPD